MTVVFRSLWEGVEGAPGREAPEVLRAAPGAGGGAHGGAGFRRPRAACWRSRAAPPRSLARQLAAAWRVVTAAADGQRLPGAAGRRAAALRGDGFPRLRPRGRQRSPGRKTKTRRLETGQTRFPVIPSAANPNSARCRLRPTGGRSHGHRRCKPVWVGGKRHPVEVPYNML